MAGRNTTPREPVDWAVIQRRVEAAGRAVAGETATSPERLRQVLEERARVLARPAVEPLGVDAGEFITFGLANESYAVESRYVVSVFRLTELSLLPGAVPPVFGVTAWRGELLTILDLRAALGLSAAGLSDLSRVIVLGENRPAFGLLTDAVRELVRVSATELRELPEGVAARREYLRGVTADALLVLDAGAMVRLHG